MDSLSQRLAVRGAADGEFRLAARYWTGSLRFDLGDEQAALLLLDGAVSAAPAGGLPPDNRAGAISLRAPVDVWAKLLAAVPPPFFNDISPARAFGLTIDAESETFWQYYPAVRRAVDLLREERNANAGSIR